MKTVIIFNNYNYLQIEANNLKEFFKKLGNIEIEELFAILPETEENIEEKEKRKSAYLQLLEMCKEISDYVEVYDRFARHKILNIFEVKQTLYEY